MLLLALTIAVVTTTIFILISFYMFIERLIFKYINKYTSLKTYNGIYKIYVFIGILGLLCTLVIIILLIRVGDPTWEEWQLVRYRHILWQQISAWAIVFSISFPALSLLARRMTEKDILEQRNMLKEAGIAAGIVLAIIGLAAPLFV